MVPELAMDLARGAPRGGMLMCYPPRIIGGGPIHDRGEGEGVAKSPISFPS